MPLELTDCLANASIYLLLSLILELFTKVAKYFGHEWHQGLFKDLGRNSELCNLLFHLIKIHVLVEFTELCQEVCHALIIDDVVRHDLLELLSGLLGRVCLGELLQCLQ